MPQDANSSSCWLSLGSCCQRRPIIVVACHSRAPLLLGPSPILSCLTSLSQALFNGSPEYVPHHEHPQRLHKLVRTLIKALRLHPRVPFPPTSLTAIMSMNCAPSVKCVPVLSLQGSCSPMRRREGAGCQGYIVSDVVFLLEIYVRVTLIRIHTPSETSSLKIPASLYHDSYGIDSTPTPRRRGSCSGPISTDESKSCPMREGHCLR